jgi:hypothetical protein
VVDEEVHLVAVVLDVPLEDRSVGGLEHHVLEPEPVDDGGCGAGVPLGDVLGDALRLDHDDRGARVERAPAAVHEVADVLLALGGQLGLARVAAGSDLEAQLGLGLEAGLDHLLHEAQQPRGVEHDEAGGDLDDVEADLFRLFEVVIDRVVAVAQHGLDPAAGGDV